MIDVMLVENQVLLTEGIQAITAYVDDIQIVGTARNGRETTEMVETLQPDVILMDIHMPDLDGVKTTIYLKEHYPHIKVVFLTDFTKEDLIVTGMNAGADGFLFTTINAEVLIQTIRNVYRNQVVIAGEAARILARKIRDGKYGKQEVLERKLKNRGVHLSNRELEIAYLLMQEKSNRYIAKSVYLSEGTVKNYISEIYNKLQLRHRHDVVDYLNGLFDGK